MCLKVVSSFLILFLLTSCSKDATISIVKENIPKEKISCLTLKIFPPNKNLQENLEKLYDFTPECPIVLEASTKSSIVCNSKFNYQQKAVNGFPSSYLKLQLSQNSSMIYSYYVDLESDVSSDDIKTAFSRMRDDLGI